jgi:hypothetical protein
MNEPPQTPQPPIEPLPDKDSGNTVFKFKRVIQEQWTEISLFIVFAVMLVVMGIFLWGNASLLQNLRDPSYARGVITFLIVVAAIALGMFLTVQTFFGVGDVKEQEEKFRRGREIHSVLVGVMGTIVGFYFGNTEKPSQELKVAPMQVVATAGGGKHLTTYVSGGTAPYRYLLTFERANRNDTNDIPVNITNRISETGWIAEDFTNSIDLTVKLSVLDKTDRHNEPPSMTIKANGR